MCVCLCVRVCERERERDPSDLLSKINCHFQNFLSFFKFFKYIPLYKRLSFSSSPLPCFHSLSSAILHQVLKHSFISTSMCTENLLSFLTFLPSSLPLSLSPFLPFSPSLSSRVFFFLVILTLPAPLTNYSLLVVMATSVALSTSLVMWLQMKTPAK